MISMLEAMEKARGVLIEFYDVPEESESYTHLDDLEKVAITLFQAERLEALTETIRKAYSPTYVYSTGEDHEVICDYIMDSKPYSSLWAECPKCGCGFRIRPSGKCNVIVEDSDE